ncbi:hypothetical protein [Psychroflexus aestuariivivens]|uniref:hypothetical protein n=1 Tax=Psychroflexus aestuariivivens TaxID=1795040 RepID=UPI000FD994E5|nr:hypothetical protein [Psychroflexus aestuariivivens]
MNEIEVKSAKIRSGMFLTFTFEKSDDKRTDTIKDDSDLPFHEDLKQAFYNLIPHLVLVSELDKEVNIVNYIDNGIDLESENEAELQFKYAIDEFKIDGSGDTEGLVLVGRKILSTGKEIKITSPKVKFYEPEDKKQYRFLGELTERLEALKTEVVEYLNGKHAPLPQQEMEFPEDDDEAFNQEEEQKHVA